MVEQLIELTRVVADAVGSGDDDLPSLGNQGAALGDGNRSAQPHRDRFGFTF